VGGSYLNSGKAFAQLHDFKNLCSVVIRLL
jgi:hypothetical protein